MLGFCKFSASLHTLIVKEPLMDKFSPPGLDCKIVLSKSIF